MGVINIYNPFNTQIYHENVVSNTMDYSKKLAGEGALHGTVIVADFQEVGKGRGQTRTWDAKRGEGLLFTILLRYSSIKEIPTALTLRAGLAVSLAIEDFAPGLKDKVFVKWPNDILINEKKAAGILCESDGGNVFLGIGVNVVQREFPLHLRGKATSISNEQLAISNEQFAMSYERSIVNNERFVLLEKILTRLFDELEITVGNNWKYHLEKRLYNKGKDVVFIDGGVDSGKEVCGCLTGVGDNGELLILPKGESAVRDFVTGEIRF